jgi:hypothetical protein
MTSIFNRALSPVFIAKLKAEAEKKKGWWADVLADPKLFIGLRGKYLNIYWHGQSLFYVKPSPSGLNVTTHEKYLLDPDLKSQVSLTDGSFEIDELRKKGFIDHYTDKTTLAKIKRAVEPFSGLEKTGCHEIAVVNHAVIDCEISFPDRITLGNGKVVNAPRVDLASLERVGSDARLVFWEAKHFSNHELRAADKQVPPVCYQVKGYQKYLSANREDVVKSYKKVARNLVAIDAMRPKSKLSPLIAEVGIDERRLTLDEEPKVGLIIFGFDIGQRDHRIWQDHLKGLKAHICPVLAVGNAKELRLPT